jgi:hypothetical protein
MQTKLCRIFGKKKTKYPQIKRICWDLLTMIKSYSQIVTVGIIALVWVLGRIQKRLLMFINLLQDGTYPSRD